MPEGEASRRLWGWWHHKSRRGAQHHAQREAVSRSRGIHLTFGVTGETVDQDRDRSRWRQKCQCAGLRSAWQDELPDFFDVNSVGSDSHLQFTNWTIDNNGAWDYRPIRAAIPWAACWSTTTGSGRHVTPLPLCRRGQRYRPRLGLRPCQRQNWSSNCARASSHLCSTQIARARARVELCEPRAHGRLPRIGATVSFGPVTTPDITRPSTLVR